ncbi:MAG: shikimate dehydrogenase [Bacteroidia bacterium]|nr:shikimate dehydrogenase [Bacteroidia bacterium]
MKTFGLIGLRLSHSFSKRYFEEKFKSLNLENHFYNLYELENINEILTLKNKNLVGLNVTIPYKETVIHFLDDISNEAKLIGAVNTIKCDRNQWKGYNTDYFGIISTLSKFEKEKINGCLVLGTGGTSKTVCFVLNQLNIFYKCVSRDKTGNEIINYNQIDRDLLNNYNLIVNTTPLGMFPHPYNCPEIPYHLLNDKNILVDMIYNPTQTLFMKKGEEKGCITLNGLNALYIQAEESWKIWNS